jgi:hypothetical protein
MPELNFTGINYNPDNPATSFVELATSAKTACCSFALNNLSTQNNKKCKQKTFGSLQEPLKD